MRPNWSLRLLRAGLLLVAPVLIFGTTLPLSTRAQIGDSQKISNLEGGFGGILKTDNRFGVPTADLGDLDGDGTKEVAVGTTGDAGAGTGDADRGAVWILSLNGDGTVAGSQKISDNAGGFGATLDDGDTFGNVADAGDIDGDGTTDLAVGTFNDDDGGSNRGAVWILFLNEDGTVSDHQKISDTRGSFEGTLNDEDKFCIVAGLGDLNLDNVPDLAVGAIGDDDGGGDDNTADRGAVWILFLNEDGTVSGQQKISDTQGGFDGILNDGDQFGYGIGSPSRDIDGDGIADLAVGARGDDDGGNDNTANRGAVWILFLNEDGTVSDHQKISDTHGNFEGLLSDGDQLGFGTFTALEDLDNNGVPDLTVGAPLDDDGGTGSDANRGAFWILYLESDGTVANEQKVSDTQGGFGGALDDEDQFGISSSGIGDLNGDGLPDLAVGANGDDDENNNAGALWILFGEPAILPVEIARFRATATEEGARLTWQTTSETDNAGFEVQHKEAESPTWTQVGYVASNAPGGTTTERQLYSYTAEDVPIGPHWFRLKQVDLEGSGTLTDPVRVDVPLQEAAKLTAPTPNPVPHTATLSFAVKEQSRTTITLYNTLGQRVDTVYDGVPPAGELKTARIDATGLPSGTYFLRLQADGRTRTQRLTVVR